MKLQGITKTVYHYRNAMEDKIGSDIEFSWKKKTGESVKTKLIMVPKSYMGEMLALHFI